MPATWSVNLAFRWLWSERLPPAHPIAAVSHEVELLDLARLISRLYDIAAPSFAIDPGLSPQRYTADPAPFLNALHSFALVPGSLEEQIFDTALGLQRLQGFCSE
jgi:hypothetical protein